MPRQQPHSGCHVQTKIVAYLVIIKIGVKLSNQINILGFKGTQSAGAHAH